MSDKGDKTLFRIRTFFQRHPALALGLVALALVMKVLVPVGFMPVAMGKAISVAICDGHGDARTTTIALPGSDDGESRMAKAAKVCPFSVLSVASLGGIDAAFAAALLLFILAIGFMPSTLPSLRRVAFLTPPSCGPPARV